MKKLIFIFCIFSSMLNSCSSDDSSDTTNPPSDSVLVKSITETYDGDETTITTYTYSGNKLVGSSDTDGHSEEYIYTGDLLTMVKEYENGNLDFQTELEYDNSNRLISESFTLGAGGDEVNTFTYNADGTITKLEAGENTYIYTYATNGNLISQEDVDEGQDYTFTYDTKNNPFKNIHQRAVFELMGYYTFENNLLDEINTGGAAFADESSFSYTYNSANYPVSAVETVTIDSVLDEIYNIDYTYE